MEIKDLKNEFLDAYEKHFDTTLPDLLASYDKYFLEHLKIIEKLIITPNYFYNKINEYLVKKGKKPTIHDYNERNIIKIIKEDKLPKNKLIDFEITIDKQNKIKNKLSVLWNTSNIYKTHAFL
ncbi:MAG TPA: hypothetical protein PKI46_02860, partial [Bacteroidales bacterium]|nr:hypothetical protein [Bacteroidales bacterium]